MSVIPSVLRPLALRCLAAVSLCSALVHGATGDGTYKSSFLSGLQFPIGVEGNGSILHNHWRLGWMGTPDETYESPAVTPTTVILVQPNGEAYLRNGYATEQRFERLRSDGSRDMGFNVTADSVVPGLGGIQIAIAQPDGKLLVAGSFTTVNGVTRNGLARLNQDGSLDLTFDTGLNLTSKVNTIAQDQAGNILVGGSQLPHPSGRGRTSLARFTPDGTRDLTFAPGSDTSDGFLIQPDGKIVSFHMNLPMEGPWRYHPDGSVDTGFNLAVNGVVKSMALQADGKFLVTGNFTQVGSHTCGGFARIHPDGSPDPTYSGKTLRGPDQVLITDKHETIILGNFGQIDQVPTDAAKVTNPTAVTSVQQVSPNTVRWMRGGGAAELHWVKAELFQGDAGEIIQLGLAQRIPGGWEITSPVPISNGTVRFTGHAINSYNMRVLIEDSLQVGNPQPWLVVTVDQQVLPQGETYDWGNQLLDVKKTICITLENRGGKMPSVYAYMTGLHGRFDIAQITNSDLRAGERRSYRVTSLPSATGERSAQIVFAGDYPTRAGYVIPFRVHAEDTLNPVFNSADEVAFGEIGFTPSLLKMGTVTLNFAPPPHTVLRVFGRQGWWSTYGAFADVPDKSYVTATHNGVLYTFLATYETFTFGSQLRLRLIGPGDPIPGFTAGSNTTCNSLAIQPDGKMLVGGAFNTIGGAPRKLLARLHPDGSADLSFNAAPGNRVDTMVVQDDGRILIGGLFNTVSGVARKGIARLNDDGSLDYSFDLRGLNGIRTRVDTNRFLKLRSGKILIGGQFTSLLDIPMQNIARLNSDGTLDQTFTATIQGTTPETAFIYSMYEQRDGKILVGGRFTGVNGVPRSGLARLNADGTLDTSFGDIVLGPNPGPVPGGTETRVSSLLEQPDGKVLIGGEFTSVLGQPRTRFARLHADGSLDTTFSPTANNTVSALALQEDGRLLASGLFTQVSGETRTRAARLNADGSLDSEFQPEVDATITSLVIDRHGKVWITGDFTKVSELPIKGITKLDNHGPGLSLSIENGTTAFWSAGASAPVLREVVFELSTDGGANWSPLGNATKVPGGWSLENLTLPAHGFLRAKGYGIASNRTSSEIEETLLFGRALTKIEQWRAETFGSPTNQRTGADLNDADKDGLANLMEYAFNLDPQDASSAQVPAWTNDASKFEINFTPPANVEGVRYGAEWSSTMSPTDWQDVTNQGTGDGHRYVVPKDSTPLKFMRVKVTNMGSVPPP